jgi:hypothetical protein
MRARQHQEGPAAYQSGASLRQPGLEQALTPELLVLFTLQQKRHSEEVAY